MRAYQFIEQHRQIKTTGGGRGTITNNNTRGNYHKTAIEKSEEQLQKEQEEEEPQIKRQHFCDVLGSYAGCLASTVKDELSNHTHYMNMGDSTEHDLL